MTHNGMPHAEFVKAVHDAKKVKVFVRLTNDEGFYLDATKTSIMETVNSLEKLVADETSYNAEHGEDGCLYID